MVTTVNGQTAREIIDTAIEKTGGLSNWGALNGFRITAWFDQGGVDFPLEIVQLKDGRQYTKINFQETEIMQGVFDGETLWSTNFQTQTPEKADLETTANVKLDANDFPDDLLGYQRKNYTVELLGKTTLNSVPCFKIKLTKEPVTINGVKSDDLVYYYFNTSTFLPFAKEFEMKHGPIQGSTMLIQFEDYRQVDGLFFPFSMLQGVKDAPPQPLKVESIELNPDISQRVFIFSK
ncbi:MAG: hypothetical protein DHS20C17_18170 [Cyclobacteriaceae bacterium]|nr:MAG: hypothetical protein DHS20C17_18170 [Cyclobacteriaceae bacterium]